MSQLYIKSAAGSSPVAPDIQFARGNDGIAVPPNGTTGVWEILGDNAQGVDVTGDIGTNTTTITVFDATSSQKGVVLLPTEVIALNYTNVTTAMSPYTVLATDYFISCDATAGAITINLPNSTTTKRELIVKDRVGAASTNPIHITTSGGSVTIDGATTVSFTDNYESLEMVFNGTNYETF